MKLAITVLQVILSLALIAVVMLQSGKSAGLSGAIAGGADRLELCSALAVGGLTPSPALLRQIRQISDIPVRCLMRTRGGDFFYTPEEIRQMAMEIKMLREAGADGFVIGCLDPEGNLDSRAMAPLLQAAQGCGLTLHRCIDVSRDPVQTYLDAGKLGIDTVLTSGAAGSCTAGIGTIEKLLKENKILSLCSLALCKNAHLSADDSSRLFNQLFNSVKRRAC